MKNNKLTFTLAIVVSLLCISNFIYKIVTLNKADYLILVVGIFFIGFGVATYFRKKN